jgi:hypothetical protein
MNYIQTDYFFDPNFVGDSKKAEEKELMIPINNKGAQRPLHY